MYALSFSNTFKPFQNSDISKRNVVKLECFTKKTTREFIKKYRYVLKKTNEDPIINSYYTAYDEYKKINSSTCEKCEKSIKLGQLSAIQRSFKQTKKQDKMLVKKLKKQFKENKLYNKYYFLVDVTSS